MKWITITLFLASMNLLFSQTLIPAGNVSGNWNLSDSPFLIEGEIAIPIGNRNGTISSDNDVRH